MVPGLDQIRSQVVPRRALALAMAALCVACDRPAAANDGGTVASAASRPPGYIVDSIHPPETTLRRFRAGLEEPHQLDGPRTRDELVRRFVAAVHARNAQALRALTISRAEFAYLVYPESRLSKPPYRQPPEITWFLLEAGTGAAVQKLVTRGADRFQLLGYRCPALPEPEGALRIWTDCMVEAREGDSNRELRLFGRIVERNGRFKFVGLQGDL